MGASMKNFTTWLQSVLDNLESEVLKQLGFLIAKFSITSAFASVRSELPRLEIALFKKTVTTFVDEQVETFLDFLCHSFQYPASADAKVLEVKTKAKKINNFFMPANVWVKGRR